MSEQTITGATLNLNGTGLQFHGNHVAVQAQPHQQAVAIFDGHGHAFLITDLTDLEDLPLTNRQRIITATRLRALADGIDRKADQ
jgi:hypothetical protein